MPADNPEPLEILLGVLAPPALLVAPILQERLLQVAKEKRTASAWDWVEQQVGRPLAEPMRAMIDGSILMWLTFISPMKHRKGQNRKKLANVVSRVAKALADDPAFMDYQPTLHQLAKDLRRQDGNVARDKMLIRNLGQIFESELGDKPTSTPNGEFCRLVDAVWEILPEDQRCSRPAFVQYV